VINLKAAQNSVAYFFMLYPITTAHAPADYVEMWAAFIGSLSDEANALNQVHFSFEREPVGKTVSAGRINHLREIAQAHRERLELIEGLINSELSALTIQQDGGA
jgi:midasin (ATPase involved in ribosome maturation)